MAIRWTAIAVLACSALPLMGSPPDAAARDGAVRQEALERATAHASPGLMVTMSVSRADNEATYGITLKNTGGADVRDIFIAGSIAPGTTFLGPGPNPARSGFRGVEGNATVWLSEVVPPYATLGPFTYRVRLSGDTAEPVRAWVHWLRPSDEIGISGPIRVLPGFTIAPLASGSVDALSPGPLMWRVVDVNAAPQSAVTISPSEGRVHYVYEGIVHFGQDGVTGSYGSGSGRYNKPGSPYVFANRGDGPARYLGFFPTSTAGRGVPPASRSTFNFAYESEDLVGLRSGPYDVLLLHAEWQPGANSPLHDHPGPVIVHLLSGTVAHTDEGVTQTYRAGSFWVEQVGARVTTKNTGSTKAVAIAALLIPKGEDVAHFLEPPNPLSFR